MGEVNLILRFSNPQTGVNFVQVFYTFISGIGDVHGVNILVLDIGVSGGEDTFRTVRQKVRLRFFICAAAAKD